MKNRAIVFLMLATFLSAPAPRWADFNPGYASFERGLALFNQGHFAESVPYFERATEKIPSSVRPIFISAVPM